MTPLAASVTSPNSIALSSASLEIHLDRTQLGRFSNLVKITPKEMETLDIKWSITHGPSVTTFESEEPLPARVGVLIESNDKVLVATPRRIPLEGLTNFRDFGGYKGIRRDLRWGLHYRSENLSSLTSSQWGLLREMGITRVIDLRNPLEKELQPTTLEEGSELELFEIEINGRIKGYDDGLLAVTKREITQITEDDMVHMYLDIVENHLDDLALAVSLVESNSTGATLVHCTAGKDRTGLVAALIQIRAGVPMLGIQEDYLLSNLYRTPYRLRQLKPFFEQHQIAPLSVKPFLSAPWKAMKSALEELDRSHPQLLNPTKAEDCTL